MMQAQSIGNLSNGCSHFPMRYDGMAAASGKKRDSEIRAKAIYRRLMEMPRFPDIDSNNNWTSKAGVSTSFFTNLQGSNKKSASEPSIGNLRLILEAANSSIPEFFVDEAKGRLVRAPTRQAIEEALAAAWAELPKRQDRRVAYLASAVLSVLGLPESIPATEREGGDVDPEEAPPAPVATKRA